jgi:hypothetical protein
MWGAATLTMRASYAACVSNGVASRAFQTSQKDPRLLRHYTPGRARELFWKENPAMTFSRVHRPSMPVPWWAAFIGARQPSM